MMDVSLYRPGEDGEPVLRSTGHVKPELDSIMTSENWNPEWFLGVDSGGRFAVVDGGMPLGVQIVGSGSTTIEACQNAIARKLTAT